MAKRADKRIRIHVLPGGKMPKRQTKGAVGYDVCLRSILCPHEMDQDLPHLRKMIYDFRGKPNASIGREHYESVQRYQKRRWVYRLEPGRSVLGGIGFVTEMPFPMFYWVCARSGLASKHGIILANAPGTVDPDYRGEAGVIIRNVSPVPFNLYRGMRIGQIIFQEAVIPKVERIRAYGDLGKSARGSGGFGSTRGF